MWRRKGTRSSAAIDGLSAGAALSAPKACCVHTCVNDSSSRNSQTSATLRIKACRAATRGNCDAAEIAQIA